MITISYQRYRFVVMALYNEVYSLAIRHPWMVGLITIILSIVALCLVITEIFKPVGKRDPNARLPPGPKGVWLLGSLSEFARRKGEALSDYVCT
jgi:hypothetical protein